MNLFILHRDPVIAASMNCDKHVVKIILEAIEMLGYAYIERGLTFEPMSRISAIDRFPFRQHFAHPMSKWVRASESNFKWTLSHLEELLNQYSLRYGKTHKYASAPAWIRENKISFQIVKPTTEPRCFGEYKEIIVPTEDIVEDYRRYYCLAKRSFARWKNTTVPAWYHYGCRN